MNRFFTTYWQWRDWQDEVNPEGEPLKKSGSNRYMSCGVSAGDVVYVISVGRGQLHLGGKMTVGRIVPRETAIRILRDPNLYDDAKWWIIAKPGSGTPLNLRRRLTLKEAQRLSFRMADGSSKPLTFDSVNWERGIRQLSQTVRLVRELTEESANLLDRIILKTDRGRSDR